MRYLQKHIEEDLKRKMVFIGGPRQCGKTTLARSILSSRTDSSIYLNWDDDKQKKKILNRSWSDTDQLIVFDEIHKYKRWKNWLKGIFDTERELHQFLVTGSARLDVYRRGGDSLMGRYHYWRLHPFTLSELPPGIQPQDAFKRLMNLGGFPEPFLEKSETFARRWRRERIQKVIRDDIRDLEAIKDLPTLEMFLDLLKSRVGGPVVLKNLAEDLHVSQPTLKHWLEILERMYLIFTVRPFTQNLPRAILKPPKVYFYDNADVEGDDGAKFENLVATHLLKTIQYLEDRDGHRYELRYVRDKDGREVDFVILKDRKLIELIEAKWSQSEIHQPLLYFSEKLKPQQATQVIGQPFKKHVKGKLQIVSAIENLQKLERWT